MADFKDEIEEKVGPLPAWVWGVIAAGCIVLFEMWRRANSSAQAAAAAAASTPVAATDDDTTPADTGDLETSADAAVIPSSSATDTSTDSTLTQTQWIAEAESYAIAHGHDATESFSALQNFVATGQVAAADQPMISQVLGAYGPPPDGPSTVSIAPAAAATAKTTNYPTYTISSSDTVNSLAQKIYGTTASWATMAIRTDINSTAGGYGTHIPGNDKLSVIAGRSITINPGHINMNIG